MISKFLIPLVLIAFMGVAHGADKLWVGLYLGQEKAPASKAIVAPPKLTFRLHDVFGFKHYELLQSQDVNLKSNWEHWILSRKDFFMRVQPLPHATGDIPRIDYEIYKDGFIIAKGKYQLNPDVPLFINGPDFHQGRLIFVVEAK